MRVFLAIALLIAPAIAADTVEGRVFVDDTPLPGCMVTLSSATSTRVTLSNVDGRYTFDAVAPGPYEVAMELHGLRTETRSIIVREITRVEDVTLSLDPAEMTMTLSCGMSECSPDAPKTPFDRPLCDEYDLNTTLLDSMDRGDSSAIDLLRRRYEDTFTYFERHRIAGALLGRVVDDRKYWNELSEHAANAIRFPYVDHKPTQEYLDWCQARDVDPDYYRWMGLRALGAAGADRRARPLITDGLASEDIDVVEAAFIATTDERFVPKIESALNRFPEKSRELAMWLFAFRSDAADQLARKFLDEEALKDYAEDRRLMDCATMTPCDP